MSKTLTNITGEDLLLKDKTIIYAGKTETLEDNVAAELLAKYPTSLSEVGAQSETEPVKPKRTRKAK